MSEGGRFLARWSRLKKAAESESALVPAAEIADGEALLAKLGPDSDFGVFMREEISESVRRQAMKQLFADPHFNVMDGLDTYIADYSLSDPIPEAMLATLNQAKMLFETAEEDAGAVAQDAGAGCDILPGAGQNAATDTEGAAAASENQ